MHRVNIIEYPYERLTVLKPHQFNKIFILFVKASRGLSTRKISVHNKIHSLRLRKNPCFRVIANVTENLVEVRWTIYMILYYWKNFSDNGVKQGIMLLSLMFSVYYKDVDSFKNILS